MSPFRDRTSWYLGLSAYWFATSAKWFILLLVVLPGQVEKLVPEGEKGGAWGTVVAIGALWAMVGPSLFGYLSDRLMARLGNRRIFLVLGAALTIVALVVLLGANSLWVIVFGYLLLQIADDVGTGPYAALIPELVPEDRRGRASGMMGLMQVGAQVLIGVLALALGAEPGAIYIALAVINVLCAIWVLQTIQGAKPLHSVPDSSTETGFVVGFIKGWAEPWKSRDFFWVWFTRFLNAFGFYLVQNYLRFYLTDRVVDFGFVGSGPEKAGMATNVLALLISVAGIFGALYAAKAADRIGRKRVIYLAGSIMSVLLVPFAVVPNFYLILVLAAVFGFGYGAYLSADWALASDVIPNKSTPAKDMGVWSMSVTVVQFFTGMVGFLVDALNRNTAGLGYTVTFLLAAVFFFLSTVLVRQVRGST